MFCPNCRNEVNASGGYCNRCGVSITARLCPRGHVMDPAWAECPTCHPGAGRAASSGAAPGSKGRTVIESPSNVPAAPAGGFVKGATLLEGFGGAKAATVHEALGVKGGTVASPGAPSGKARTVFDPGTAGPSLGPGTRSGSSPRTPLPRLAGWLVTFSNDPSGVDYRLREGRNTVGCDEATCDIVIADDPSVSSQHAILVFRDGTFQIRDNDSTNGTYVNGQDIFGKGAVSLKNLDRIRLGKTEVVLYAIQP